MCALDFAPRARSLGSELMACVLLSWYFPLPSSLVSCGVGRAVAALTGAHTRVSFLLAVSFPASVLFCSAPARLALRPRSVQLGTLPAQAGPRDLAIKMNSLMHEGLYDHIPTAGMSEGRLAGSHVFHVYPLSVDDKFTSFTDYC